MTSNKGTGTLFILGARHRVVKRVGRGRRIYGRIYGIDECERSEMGMAQFVGQGGLPGVLFVCMSGSKGLTVKKSDERRRRTALSA